MQISKNTTQRVPGERPMAELICAGHQASFLTLLNNGNSRIADAPHTLHPPPVSRREEITHLHELIPARNLQTLEQLHVRLTNGALAGMLIEAHQQAGKLTMRLRLSGIQRSDRYGDWLAELKRELAAHFEPLIHLEFFDSDAPTD